MIQLSVGLNKSEEKDIEERVDLCVYRNLIVVSHSYPITPWKTNYDTILHFDQDSAILFAQALLKAAVSMREQEEDYRES